MYLYYYVNFFAQYETAKLQNKSALEKEIEEYKNLAGWDSKNYLVLKATVEKFQQKIHRILRKYKEFLVEPLYKHVLEPQRNSNLVNSF